MKGFLVRFFEGGSFFWNREDDLRQDNNNVLGTTNTGKTREYLQLDRKKNNARFRVMIDMVKNMIVFEVISCQFLRYTCRGTASHRKGNVSWPLV